MNDAQLRKFEPENAQPVCCGSAQRDRRPGDTTRSAVTVAPAPRHTTDGMVRLSGGEFLMGDGSGEGYAADGEGPARRVRIDPFWIDACAVSNAAFAEFVAATGYVTDAERFGWSFVFAGLLPDDFPPTRAFTDDMKERLGARAIAFQDMSGAGGVQALDYVQRQPADGHTWLGANDVIEAYPSLGRIDYDWRAFDFWMSGGTSCAICVRADSPIETFDQFANEISDNPGRYSVSSTPSGSLWSNAAVYLQKQVGLDFRLANYGGGAPAVRALLAAETDFGCIGVTPLVNFIEAGELRAIATWTPEAWETAGTVIPSIAEFVDDPILRRTLPWTNIHGIATRKGVDEAILEKIDDAFNQAMQNPIMDEIYAENAFFPFRAPRQEANDLMGERTALQAYIIEVILGTAVKTRDELDIPKIEEA